MDARAVFVALALAGAAVCGARGQGNGAAGDAARSEPAWVGTWADPAGARVVLRAAPGGDLRGTLRLAGSERAIAGQVAAGSLTGRVGDSGELSARLEGDVLVLTLEGAVHRLARCPDLSRVRKGQRYHYNVEALQQPWQGSETFEVVEVGERTVQYTSLLVGCVISGPDRLPPPTPREWSAPEPAPRGAGGPRRERVTAAGLEWDCLVIEKDGATSWVPLADGRVTFPPYVKKQDAEAVRELFLVLEPP